MKDGFIVFSVLLQIIGTLLFVYGFFPQRIVIDNDNPNELNNGPESKPNRLVFMIIDAFAYDFVSNSIYSNDMPKLQKSIKSGESMLFRAHVQSPTVTLPRIKALVSGTVPAYMDVVFNFAQTQFNEDNWLKRAKQAGYRILFYGDDTWLSMFTMGLFLDRSEGTSSFFVKDYTEVDTNITRYLEGEFSSNSKNSWDILILHYLGLDHIGHSLGGKNPQIHKKLNEMDTVIDGIRTNFTKSKGENETIWFVLIGDHGMTNTGGHGGSSDRESHVPILLWSSSITNQQKTIFDVEQVDLVPTLSFLLNLGIPEKSVGILMDEYFLNDLDLILERMEVNAKQLYELALSNKPLFSGDEFDELKSCTNFKDSKQDKKEFISNCRAIFKRVQRKFLFSNENLNYPFIIIGILISLLATTTLLFNRFKNQSISIGLFILIQPFSLFSSSFIEEEHDLWYYLFTSYICIEVLRVCWNKKTKILDSVKLYDLLILLIAHRIARYPCEVNRRRWVLEGLFIDSKFFIILLDEFGILNILPIIDEKTYLWYFGSILFLVFNYPFHVIFNKQSKSSSIFYLLTSVVVLAVKFSFIENSLIPHSLIFFVFFIGGWSKGFIVWQLLVLNPTNYPIALLCQLIGYKLGEFNESVKFDHSLMLYAALSATFFYTGSTNTLDTIDVVTGYAGLSDYIFLIVGLQISLNAYMGIVNLIIGWNLAKKSPRTSIKSILLDIFAIRSMVLFFTMLNLFHQRSHLFNWSVFTPKLLLEGLHFLNVCVWAIFEYFLWLYMGYNKGNKLL